jgi:hypothetical protein
MVRSVTGALGKAYYRRSRYAAGGSALRSLGILGRCHRVLWRVIALKLDFTAQVFGHLFKGLDKIVANA